MFLDESGDSNLKSVDPNHPVFALVGCIFKDDYYQSEAIPLVNDLKIKYFKTKKIILHSRDIRKQENKPFLILRKEQIRKQFYLDLNQLFTNLNFYILSVVIDKNKLKKKYYDIKYPYFIALEFILERFVYFLKEKKDIGKLFFESRNNLENSQLDFAFTKIKLYGTKYVKGQEFQERIKELWFIDKKQNEIGTQLADLIAYPIATYILPERDKKAFEIIKSKIIKSKNEKVFGYGLKIFP